MGFERVYKRNGLNCVDINGTCTYLPDNLSGVDGFYIEDVFYARVVIVETSI